MLTQERIAAPLLGELMRWNVPYRMLAPERAGPSPWGEIPELAKRAVDVGEPLPGVGRLPAFAKQRYEEARAYEPTLPAGVRLVGRQLLDPLGLGGAWASTMLTGPLGAIYRIVDIADYTAFLLSATPDELKVAAALIGVGITARNLPKIRAFVKRVAGGATPAMRRAAQEAAPAVQRFMAEEAGAAEILGRPPVPSAERWNEIQDQLVPLRRRFEELTYGPIRAQRRDNIFERMRKQIEALEEEAAFHKPAVEEPAAAEIPGRPPVPEVEPEDFVQRVSRRVDEDSLKMGRRLRLSKPERLLTVVVDGEPAWSYEGFFIEVGETPARFKGAQSVDRGAVSWLALFEGEGSPALPMGTARGDYLADKVKTGDEVVFISEAGDAISVATRYWGYFQKKYKDAEWRMYGPDKGVEVRSRGRTVGFIMPFVRQGRLPSEVFTQWSDLVTRETPTTEIGGKTFRAGQRVRSGPQEGFIAETAHGWVMRADTPLVPGARRDIPLRDIADYIEPIGPDVAAPVRPEAPVAVPEAAPEAMRPMEVPPEEAARLAREAEEAAGQRALGAPAPEAKEYWQMTREEYEGRRLYSPSWDPEHREVIEEALAEARPVPAKVLAEYPDLARAAPAPEAPPVRAVAPAGLPDPWTLPRDLYVRATGATDRADVLQAQMQWRTGIEEAYRRGEIDLGTRGLSKAADMVIRDLRARPPAPVRAPVTRPVTPGVAPLAEPAVPPPAVPAFPPVTAQPVPGAGGIPGQPLAPGAGAAVVAPAGRPVQPPLAAAGVQIAPGGPPAGAVPPAAPPGAVVPPPGSPQLPGFVTRPPTAPGRLASILDSGEILSSQRRPDLARRMMTFAETHHVTPMVKLLRSIGISGTDPATEAAMLAHFITVEGRVASIGAVSDLRGFGDVQKLFGAKDLVVSYRGKDYFLGDIMEGMHPELPLTADQLRFMQMGWELGDELHAFAKAHGVDIPLAKYGEGQHWWHRGTVYRRNANGLIDTGVIRGGRAGRYVAAMMGIEKPRQFDTMADARAQGFYHLDPTDAMQVAVQDVYRRIGDERLKAHVLEHIASRTEAPARWGEVELPGMPGRFFEAGEVGPVRDYLRDLGLSWVDTFATGVNIVNRVPRTVLTSLDPGPALLQLQGVMLTYPRVWTAGVLKGWQEPFSPGAMARFLSEPQHAATLRRFAPFGLNAHGSELTEGARGIFAEHGPLTRIPVVSKIPLLRHVPVLLGKGVRIGSAIFDNQMLAIRIMGIEATEYMIKKPEDAFELVRHWNTFTGVSEPGSYGISRSQQLKEAAFGFAPKLLRSTLSIVADVFQGGLRGKMARESLGKMGVLGLLGYLAICQALNQKPRLDPKEGSRWMTVTVGDQVVGFGGPYFMVLRTLIQMATGGSEAAVETAGRFVRSRLSPGVSTGWDVLTRKDAIAMPVPMSIPKLTQYVLKNNLIPIWLQGVTESGVTDWENYIEIGAMELAGLRVFPVSPARKRNEIRERLAQATFGKPWASLSRPETYQLEQVPELGQAVEEARALALKRETPWGLFWADVDSQREPYRIEIAELGQELQAGQRTGRSYREELTQRQMIMARIPEMLQRTREYQDIRLEGREPETAVDRFIDAYYKIADETRDPLTGVADARQIVMDREALKTRTPDDVVRQAMGYINRKLDPEYVQARDLYYEYMRIPQYLGLNEDEAQLANEAIRTYRDMRRANPQMHPDWTRAYLAKYNPEGYKLMLVAQRRRNPARQRFWAAHPLLSKFYSDLTTEELELVLPEENLWQPQPQARLPAFAGSLSYGQ